MRVLKLVVKLLVMLALAAYIVMAFIKEKTWKNTSPCKQLVVAVMDSNRATFVSKDDVRRMLEAKGLNPEGRPMDNIDLRSMEQTLEAHKFILDAVCYKTADDRVHVDISQRLPVMRVMAADGSDYYIDSKGQPLGKVTFTADVVVATGHISRKYAKKVLAPLGRALQEDDFWNSQIEQLNVERDGTLEMAPRVGNHVVYFGQPSDMARKLKRLKTFYEKVLCQVGWNKYSRIDLEYGNQIICTKTE